MAILQRSRLLKSAFCLCILLILLFQSSTFRSRIDRSPYLSNLTIRFSSDVISNSLWLMRPNFEHTPRNTSNSHALLKIDDSSKLNSTNHEHSHYVQSGDELRNATRQAELVKSHNSQTPSVSNNGEQPSGNETAKADASGQIQFFKTIMRKFGLLVCPTQPTNLIGPIDVDVQHESIESIESRFRGRLLNGGWYKPTECAARDRVAIVVPYRDRADHLPIFLKNIHPFLMKQQIEYGIFIVEQTADHAFNRASLLNVGFKEAMKLHQWDCFIFHDVDLLPLDDRNLYTCPDQPRHMSVAVDTFGYRLPYYGIFGGACAMTRQQFQTVNGFSNSFWGWGGEDDDMSNRLRHFGYHISRYPYNIARYKMLNHRKDKASPNRFEKLKRGMAEFNTEGLNSLKYEVESIEKTVLYTRVLVELKTETLMNALAAFFTKIQLS